MRSICLRCALRIRIAESRNPSSTARAFSSGTPRRRTPLPNFTPTSQPELDDILASLRYKHLLPAALSNAERNLIYKPKYKQNLIDNPEIVTLGDEDITLEHINRLADVPSLKKEILPKVVESMSKGEPSDWNQLPELLRGLQKAKMTPRYEVMGKIARKAIEAGQFDIILQCLQQSSRTEMTLSKVEVLYNVIYGLRATAMNDRWGEESLSKAIRDANEVAKLLDDERHGSGKVLRTADPRSRPYILAVFLELSAIHAYKYQDGKDVDGKVKAYAERLLYNMKHIPTQLASEIQQKAAAQKAAEAAEDAAKKEYEAVAGSLRSADGVVASTPDAKSLQAAKENLKVAQEALIAARAARKNVEFSKDDIAAKAGLQPRSAAPRPTGAQYDILHGTVIYHSLTLAQRILGADIPEPTLAQEVTTTWKLALEKLVDGLKRQASEEKISEGKKRTIRNLTKGKEGTEGRVNRWPKSGTYGWQAMRFWRSRLAM